MAMFNTRDTASIVANLRRRGRRIEQAAKLALSQGVNEIVQTAKRLVPVDTGNLQRSLHAEEQNEGTIYKITADAKNKSGVPYGKFVEYDPRINKPFLYPAIEQNKQRLNERLKTAMQREI